MERRNTLHHTSAWRDMTNTLHESTVSTPDGSQSEAPTLPRLVWATGWVSYLTDLSTELVYALLPVYYSVALHLNTTWQGLIEGVAESLASITKLFSGQWSDRTGGRKWWMVAGYGLSGIAKPLLALSSGGLSALALRSADRFGKGIRSAPRDSFLSRAVAPNQRGRVFGIQRAMDHAGAFSGALLASAFMFTGWMTLRQLFLWTLLPGAMAVVIIIFCVHESRDGEPKANKQVALSPLQAWREQSLAMKRYLLVATLFSLGNSTDALLLLRAREQFLNAHVAEQTAAALLPLLWAWLHIIKSATSAWGGRLSDRTNRLLPLRAGWLVYAIVYAGFSIGKGWFVPWVLFGVYGLYFGLVEGPERALVADLSASPAGRGAAYGLFHFIIGISALPASILCGALWHHFGAGPAFLTGAALALLAASLLPWALHDRYCNSPPTRRQPDPTRP